MRWQDLVISAAQLVGVFSLLPSIFSHHKPALATSLMNVSLVAVIATCMITLHLWFAATTAYLIAVSWSVLAVQKYQIRQLDKKKTPSD